MSILTSQPIAIADSPAIDTIDYVATDTWGNTERAPAQSSLKRHQSSDRTKHQPPLPLPHRFSKRPSDVKFKRGRNLRSYRNRTCAGYAKIDANHRYRPFALPSINVSARDYRDARKEASQSGEDIVKTNYKVAIAIVAGAAIGGAAIQGIHAQAKPPVYVVSEITVSNADAYAKEYAPISSSGYQEIGR
jgi:hypothetical protein